MTKTALIVFIVLWMPALPIVLLAIGFAGNTLWSPSALLVEISSGQLEGVLIRLGLLLYALSPIMMYRSYRKRVR